MHDHNFNGLYEFINQEHSLNRSLINNFNLQLRFLGKFQPGFNRLVSQNSKYEALLLAVRYGQLGIVKFFCEHELVKEVNINLYLLIMLNIAEKYRHADVIHYIIDFYIKVIKNTTINYIENTDTRRNHIGHYADEMLNYNNIINNQLNLQIIKYACIHKIKSLSELPLICFDPNFNNNIALKKAIIRGDLEIFEYLFQLALSRKKHSHKRLPKYTIKKIYKLAAIHGHNMIIKFLLKYPDTKALQKIDIQIILIVLREVASRPFMENKITHIECYDLIKYLLDNNLHRIAIDDLFVIVNKVSAKINHLNYDKNKFTLLVEYFQRAINIHMISVCAMFFKYGIPINGVGYSIVQYLYAEKTSATSSAGGVSSVNSVSSRVSGASSSVSGRVSSASSVSSTNSANNVNKPNQNLLTLCYMQDQLIKKHQDKPNGIAEHDVVNQYNKSKFKVK